MPERRLRTFHPEKRKEARRFGTLGILLETANAVFLHCIVQKSERKTIIEQSGAGAEHPRAAAMRLPCDAEPGRNIVSDRAK